jgi:hypothetical protein
MEMVRRSEPKTLSPALASLLRTVERKRLTWACYGRNNLLYLTDQLLDVSWRSRPEGQVISWVDILGEPPFSLEDSMQDLIKLPCLKVGVENELLEFFIPG